MRSIVGQQLSVVRGARDLRAAARALRRARRRRREEILADDPDELRAAAGLSRAKVAYLRSLAEHVARGELELDRLDELADDEVIAELVAVKGIGEWTRAHVPDVPARPARRAAPSATSASAARSSAPTASTRCPTPAELKAIAEAWRPHRTRACRYLWRSLQNTPE